MIKNVNVKEFFEGWMDAIKTNKESGLLPEEMAEDSVGVYGGFDMVPMLLLLTNENQIGKTLITEDGNSYKVSLSNFNPGLSEDETIDIKVSEQSLELSKSVYDDSFVEENEELFTVQHHKDILEKVISESEEQISFKTIATAKEIKLSDLIQSFIDGQDSLYQLYSEPELEPYMNDENALVEELSKIVELIQEDEILNKDENVVDVNLMHDELRDVLKFTFTYKGDTVHSEELDKTKYLKQLVDMRLVVDRDLRELLALPGYHWSDFKFYLENTVKLMAA
jgi:hypothetical protein